MNETETSRRTRTTKATDLELYGHHVQRGRAGKDGGVGLQKASQCRATVPEEQRVPGQEAGAEVRLTHQHRDLEKKKIIILYCGMLIFQFFNFTFYHSASHLTTIEWTLQ